MEGNNARRKFMQEKVHAQEDLTISNLFKILLQKIKILVLALIIGVIVGAGFGVLTTYNKHYYGTRVEFYINPKASDYTIDNDSQYGVYGAYNAKVMEGITGLLNSESFAEKLMVDSDGLPARGLNAQIDEKIDAAQAPLAEAKATKAEYEHAKYVYTKATETLTEANTALSAAWREYGDGEVVRKGVHDEVDAAIDVVTEAESAKKTAKENYQAKKDIAEEKRTVAEAAVEEALEEWRKTETYEDLITATLAVTTYDYYKGSSLAGTGDLAQSFVYVEINVLNNIELAEGLYERIKVVLPKYVEANMAIPTGYIGTNCQRITRLDKVKLTNEGMMLDTAVKYAIVLAIVAVVATAVAVIVIDRMDNKLKDYEQTMKGFGLPVLGVIPSLEEKSAEVSKMTNTEGEE